jgi:xanthine/uracil/vitamin C permease (AzgA family)
MIDGALFSPGREPDNAPARAAEGLTTFLTMAYMIVVNPQILSQAGMPAKAWCL